MNIDLQIKELVSGVEDGEVPNGVGGVVEATRHNESSPGTCSYVPVVCGSR